MQEYGRTPTILVVDDDRVFTMTVQRELKKMHLGETTEVARDGVEALDFLERSSLISDTRVGEIIVLLDLHMPRMDGWELLEKIGKNNALTPAAVFVFADTHTEGDLTAAHGRTISGYLRKDNARETLASALLSYTSDEPVNKSRLH